MIFLSAIDLFLEYFFFMGVWSFSALLMLILVFSLAFKSFLDILRKKMPSSQILSSIKFLAGSAPLAGLLGTLSAMMELFRLLHQPYFAGDQAMVLAAMAKALLSTIFGLIAAVSGFVSLHLLEVFLNFKNTGSSG